MSSTPQADDIGPVLALVDRVSRLLTWGLPLLGLIHAARRMLGGFDRPGLAMLDAVYLAGAYALAGVSLGTLAQALGKWLERAPLPRIAVQDQIPAAVSAALPSTALDLLKERLMADIRQAVRGEKWEEARALLDAFATDHIDDSHVAVLHQELQAARDAARNDHMAQLDAAQKVNDPDRVLELHRLLVPLLEAETRSSLEAELSRWFLRLMHNRLSTGKIQTDVALLAGRVAETFSHTVEGASLRASLPLLRRSAGLCPRCAQPYTGVADACPACMGLVQPPQPLMS
jgi:hypothetical protein